FEIGNFLFLGLLELPQIRAGGAASCHVEAIIRLAGGVDRLEQRNVDIGRTIATTADRIQQRVRCDLPVETNGPARLFAAVFDNANTVSGGAQRCNRLAVLVAQVL